MGEVGIVTEYQIRKRHKFLCRAKTKYEEEALAMAALIDLMTSETAYLPDELTIYLCRHCGFLHIGHAPRWRDDGKRENKNYGRQEELARAKAQVSA